MLRQFTLQGDRAVYESAVFWPALLGFHQRVVQLEEAGMCWRYRIADAIFALCTRPLAVLRRFTSISS